MNSFKKAVIVFILTITVSNIYSQNFRETIDFIKSKINMVEILSISTNVKTARLMII